MRFPRMPIEQESPEQVGYERIRSNLTESSVRDRTLADLAIDLNRLTLCYSDHRGNAQLRDLIAANAGAGMTGDQVLLSAGASAALFMVAITLLDKSDHVIVVRPNYATNIQTPRILQCAVDCVDLSFERGYALDIERIQALARPTTRLISITTPHNPSGVAVSPEALRQTIELAERLGIHLLVDETYRDMSFGPTMPAAATLSDRAISVGSLSKTYGIPGIRLGWAMARDADLMHRLLCAKEQIGICGSVVDEAIGLHAFAARDQWLPHNNRRLRAAFGQVQAWIAAEDLVEWVEPTGGCVCFPRIRPEVALDVAKFYDVLNNTHATYVGPGHWFEQSDRCFRIGYGWPTPDELQIGLDAISQALRAAVTTR